MIWIYSVSKRIELFRLTRVLKKLSVVIFLRRPSVRSIWLCGGSVLYDMVLLKLMQWAHALVSWWPIIAEILFHLTYLVSKWLVTFQNVDLLISVGKLVHVHFLAALHVLYIELLLAALLYRFLHHFLLLLIIELQHSLFLFFEHFFSFFNFLLLYFYFNFFFV